MNIVVILGKRLEDDGSMTEELKERVRLGYKTFSDTGADLICVCGGPANLATPVREADVMKEYLLSLGAPKDKIVEEKRSLTTLGNAFNLARLLEQKPVEKMYLVSTEYHFTRPVLPQAHRIFKENFPNTEIIKIF